MATVWEGGAEPAALEENVVLPPAPRGSPVPGHRCGDLDLLGLCCGTVAHCSEAPGAGSQESQESQEGCTGAASARMFCMGAPGTGSQADCADAAFARTFCAAVNVVFCA